LAHYQKLAFNIIDDIIKRNRLPFFVGGTALYIYAIVDNYNLSDVGANLARRKELEKLSVDELQSILIPSSPRRGRGGVLNSDDMKNPRRLIRAIEKLEAGATLEANKKPPRYDTLLLGTDIPREELYKKIDQRVDERINAGMIEEVKSLICRGAIPRVSENWLIGLGLEYRFITEYLQGKWTKDEMIKRLKGAIHAFSRRQMTWFKRDKRIIWIKNISEAEQEVNKFLK
jgi:tRNA dimethylallyltransferase